MGRRSKCCAYLSTSTFKSTNSTLQGYLVDRTVQRVGRHLVDGGYIAVLLIQRDGISCGCVDQSQECLKFCLVGHCRCICRGLAEGLKKGMERLSKQLASLYISSIRERLKALLLEAFPFAIFPAGKKSAEGSKPFDAPRRWPAPVI